MGVYVPGVLGKFISFRTVPNFDFMMHIRELNSVCPYYITAAVALVMGDGSRGVSPRLSGLLLVRLRQVMLVCGDMLLSHMRPEFSLRQQINMKKKHRLMSSRTCREA
jgi:hypothetical protein